MAGPGFSSEPYSSSRKRFAPEGLARLERADVPLAREVLADAFHDDPLWGAVFADAPDRAAILRAFTEVPVRYSLRYGGVHASSERMEGIVAWVPGRRAEMSLWGLIASGAFGSMMRIGQRYGGTMQQVFGPWTRARRRHMRARRFVYVTVVGVSREHQGQGIGGQMLTSLAEASDRSGLPVYLETETEGNVRFYDRFGFGVVETITLPLVELPTWLMVREPGAREDVVDGHAAP